MADSNRYVQTVRRGESYRTSLGGEEEKIRDKVKEQQLVAKIQRDFPLVSKICRLENSIKILKNSKKLLI